MDRSLPKPRTLKSPTWRLEQALEPSLDISNLEDPYLLEAVSLVSSGDVPTRVEEAYLLYYLPQSRAIMNSLMISDIDTSTLAESLGTLEEVIVTYSKIFFF